VLARPRVPPGGRLKGRGLRATGAGQGAEAVGHRYRFDSRAWVTSRMLRMRLLEECREDMASPEREAGAAPGSPRCLHDIGSRQPARSPHKHSQYLLSFRCRSSGLSNDRNANRLNIARSHRRGTRSAANLPYAALDRHDR